MKLKTINNKGEEEFINVDFWSFFKCYFIVNMTLAGIIYGIVFILAFIFGLLGIL